MRGVRACRSGVQATATSSMSVLGWSTLSAAVCVCGGERWRRAPDPLWARADAGMREGSTAIVSFTAVYVV